MIKPILKEHRFERAVIIVGGESLRGVDITPLFDFDGAIITVNNVIPHLKRADFWITIDPASDGKPQKSMINRRDDCYYYTAQPNQIKEPFHGGFYPIVEGIHYLERVVPDKLEDYILQEDKDKITTGDSSFSALGLAYHMGAKQILIFGLDLYGSAHWYDTESPYNATSMETTKFDSYKKRVIQIFGQAKPQLDAKGIELLNCSPNSLIDTYKRITPEEGVRIATNKLY